VEWCRLRRGTAFTGESRAGQLAIAGRLTGWIIAQWRDGFQRHVAGTLDGPFIVLLEQDRADGADDGVLIGEDADHLGAPLDLAVEALNRVSRVQLGSMLRRELI
jgi:hypothetical protein